MRAQIKDGVRAIAGELLPLASELYKTVPRHQELVSRLSEKCKSTESFSLAKACDDPAVVVSACEDLVQFALRLLIDQCNYQFTTAYPKITAAIDSLGMSNGNIRLMHTGGKLSSALSDLEDEMKSVFLQVRAVGYLEALEATRKLEARDSYMSFDPRPQKKPKFVSESLPGQRNPPFPKNTEADRLLLQAVIPTKACAWYIVSLLDEESKSKLSVQSGCTAQKCPFAHSKVTLPSSLKYM